nr:tyrosine-type recombinase/integrase [Micromonospora sp. DSM 115978]
ARAARTGSRGDAPVFSAVKGGLRDPDNTQKHLADMFAFAGLPGLTSHVFRKTVATVMDDHGLSARMAADQLGHANVSLTQNTYFGRKVRVTGARTALEVLD